MQTATAQPQQIERLIYQAGVLFLRPVGVLQPCVSCHNFTVQEPDGSSAHCGYVERCKLGVGTLVSTWSVAPQYDLLSWLSTPTL